MKRPARRELARQQAKVLNVKLREYWPQFRLPGSLRPFHRINALVEAVTKTEINTPERELAHRALAAYESRGHGKTGVFSPRFGAARSKYMPHQGKRECQRRLETA